MRALHSIGPIAFLALSACAIALAQSTTTSSTPSAATPSTPTPVTCKDGSTSKGGRGACSGHGGVNKAAATSPASTASTAATPAATKSAATGTSTAATGTSKSGGSVNTDPTGAMAKCKDGSYSHAKTHTGACSHHGGVASFLDGK